MDGLGGDKYIYPCICITAYSCWAVCSLGPTVLEAEGSALIGKGSLSSHSEAKVSGATAAPPARSPHQLCRAECAQFRAPPNPPGLRELRLLPQLQKQPPVRPSSVPSPAPRLCPQVQRGGHACFPIPQTSPPCPRHRPSPSQSGPFAYPFLALASQVPAINMNPKYI